MGIVRKPRKKYSGPNHPWEAERINAERVLKKNYGLKNKKEIWKIASKLKNMKDQAKKLIARTDDQAKKEEKVLLEKLIKLGLLNDDATLDSILEINIEKFLDRRLQSVLVHKGLARTTKQARQMISHGHISIENKKTNVPSYLVKLSEEIKIKYAPSSSFTDKEHPELMVGKKEEMPIKKETVEENKTIKQKPMEVEKKSLEVKK
jgi:small subunit ribosomal protein S4